MRLGVLDIPLSLLKVFRRVILVIMPPHVLSSVTNTETALRRQLYALEWACFVMLWVVYVIHSSILSVFIRGEYLLGVRIGSGNALVSGPTHHSTRMGYATLPP